MLDKEKLAEEHIKGNLNYDEAMCWYYESGLSTVELDIRLWDHDLWTSSGRSLLGDYNIRTGICNEGYWSNYKKPGWQCPEIPINEWSSEGGSVLQNRHGEHSYFSLKEVPTEYERELREAFSGIREQGLEPTVVYGDTKSVIKDFLKYPEANEVYELGGSLERVIDESTQVGIYNINEMLLGKPGMSRGLVFDSFAYPLLSSEGDIEAICTLTELNSVGDITSYDRHYLDSRYSVCVEGPVEQITSGFDGVLEELEPVDNLYIWMDIFFNVFMLLTAVQVVRLYYYYYFKGVYSWYDDNWSYYYKFRELWGLDSRPMEVQKEYYEQLEAIRLKTMIDWEEMVNKYVWVSEHSLEWVYGLSGIILDYVCELELFSLNWVL